MYVYNSEYADCFLNSQTHNRNGVKSTKAIIRKVDCRVFGNMLNISSLKSSTIAMNAEHALNTIYRARNVFEGNQFRPGRDEDIKRLFQLSKDALKEQ